MTEKDFKWAVLILIAACVFFGVRYTNKKLALEASEQQARRSAERILKKEKTESALQRTLLARSQRFTEKMKKADADITISPEEFQEMLRLSDFSGSPLRDEKPKEELQRRGAKTTEELKRPGGK